MNLKRKLNYIAFANNKTYEQVFDKWDYQSNKMYKRDGNPNNIHIINKEAIDIISR